MLPNSLEELAAQFKTFPGVGSRSSQKLALDVLQMEDLEFLEFYKGLKQARDNVKFCWNCGFFAEAEAQQTKVLCEICKTKSRNKYQICLVENLTDVITLERSGDYRGLFHVLNKLISPLDNIFPENTNLPDLFNRRLVELIEQKTELQKNDQSNKIEIILFFRAGFEAEATTAYIKELAAKMNWSDLIFISKLAQGLPLYYNPDTLDQATMQKALEDRREV